MTIIYANVGKHRNLAQSLLLIEHKKTPFSQTFQPVRFSNTFPINHLAILSQSQKSAFFCFFLLKFCIYAEFAESLSDNASEIQSHREQKKCIAGYCLSCRSGQKQSFSFAKANAGCYDSITQEFNDMNRFHGNHCITPVGIAPCTSTDLQGN